MAQVAIASASPAFVKNLTCKLNISLLLLNCLSNKAHIWYKGASHQYLSVCTKVKIICQGSGQTFEKKKEMAFWGHYGFTNIACSV